MFMILREIELKSWKEDCDFLNLKHLFELAAFFNFFIYSNLQQNGKFLPQFFVCLCIVQNIHHICFFMLYKQGDEMKQG